MKQVVTQVCCDLCTRPDGHLEECVICKKEFCLLCRWSGVFHIACCKKCGQENPKALEILKRYVQNWRRYNRRIEAELARVKPVKAKA